MFKPSPPLIAIGLMSLVGTGAALWFVDDHAWLLLVPLVGGGALWAAILRDISRQRIPLFQAMQDTHRRYGLRWRIVFAAAGLVYGLILGLRGG